MNVFRFVIDVEVDENKTTLRRWKTEDLTEAIASGRATVEIVDRAFMREEEEAS